jgi:hypothetical protein
MHKLFVWNPACMHYMFQIQFIINKAVHGVQCNVQFLGFLSQCNVPALSDEGICTSHISICVGHALGSGPPLVGNIFSDIMGGIAP